MLIADNSHAEGYEREDRMTHKTAETRRLSTNPVQVDRSPMQRKHQTIEMRSASNVTLKPASQNARNAAMARQVQIKRMGPDFAERSAKVVSKYSYTMP